MIASARSPCDRPLQCRQHSAPTAVWAPIRTTSSAIATTSQANHSHKINSAPCHARTAFVSQRSSRPLAVHAAAAADPVAETSSPYEDDMRISKTASQILTYALNLAIVSETYEAHSWMILLGLLKQEDCRAAKILKDMGLDDLYGAWHEVLWALNVSNGLEPRAPTPDVRFADRASLIVHGATNFAYWAGRTKVQSEDILMALAAGHVLSGLFPDLGLTFEHVRKAAAKHGCNYTLPDDSEEVLAALQEDNFL